MSIVAVTFSFCASVHVIVHEPADTTVTYPYSSTVATFSSEELQMNVIVFSSVDSTSFPSHLARTVIGCFSPTYICSFAPRFRIKLKYFLSAIWFTRSSASIVSCNRKSALKI